MSENKKKKSVSNDKIEFKSTTEETANNKKINLSTVNEFSEEKGIKSKDRSNEKKDSMFKHLDYGRIGFVILIIAVVVVVYTVVIPYTVKAQYTTGYEVYIDEDTCIGIVSSIEDMNAVYDKLYEDFSSYYGMDVFKEYELSYKEVNVRQLNIYPVEQYDAMLRQSLNVGVMAWVIMVNNAPAAVLETKEEAEWVLEQVLAPYKENANEKNRSNIGFLEDVEIVNMSIDYKSIVDSETALNLIQYGGDIDISRHTVVSGETLYSIAKNYGIRISDIIKANPWLEQDDKLYRKDVLTIAQMNNRINIVYTEKIDRTESMDFETVVFEDDSMYATESKIQQEGRYGVRDITGYATYINGYESEVTVETENIITQPVEQIVIKGTKDVPKTLKLAQSGDMMLPLKSYTITSDFGPRDTGIDGASSFHYGVDLAASYGTPIYASADGKVTFAGSSGGYGQLVKIAHEGNVETRYGHCSQILVSTGQYVEKGDIIALVGSTGISSGNHVHFEVRINGEPVDPMG